MFIKYFILLTIGILLSIIFAANGDISSYSWESDDHTKDDGEQIHHTYEQINGTIPKQKGQTVHWSEGSSGKGSHSSFRIREFEHEVIKKTHQSKYGDRNDKIEEY